MGHSISPVRLNHINLVVQNIAASVEHFRTLYGAELLADLPQREFHACLLQIGGVIMELFAPHDFLLNARYGPHYVGAEYQADMDEVREVLTAQGIRIVRDIGVSVHTHPADCFGVAFQFYNGCFHDRRWPLLDGHTMRPADYWRDQHRLGLVGLKGYTLAAADIDAAQTFIQGLLGGQIVYTAPRPDIAAQAVGLQIADTLVELLTPAGDGALQRHLLRYGDGLRSLVFSVRDLDQTRRYFQDRKIVLVPGAAPHSIAVPAEANCGAIFEFVEND